MTANELDGLKARLRALFDAISAEVAVNPRFAEAIKAAWTNAAMTPGGSRSKAGAASRDGPDQKLTKPAARPPFDPLAVHLEAALLNGREQEARAFLNKLSRAELQEVVQAQRLPGGKALQKAILEAADPASVLDDVVASAGQKVRGRHLAAGG